jgi:hypothetical protein
MASMTYYIALSVVAGEEGPMPGEAVECRPAGVAKIAGRDVP